MKYTLTILFLLTLTNAFSQGKFFGGNGDGFGAGQIAMILPVKLISFEAKLQNDKAQITWTAIAENISSIILEMSSDGGQFEWLTEKPVTHNTIVPVRYGFTDGPRTGQWYYRLKWKEADGPVAYSNTISVKFSSEVKLKAIYDAGTVVITKPANASLIELYSVDGKLQKRVRSGQNLCRIPVNELPAGIYIVKIPGHIYVTRFVK